MSVAYNEVHETWVWQRMKETKKPLQGSSHHHLDCGLQCDNGRDI